MGPSWKELTFGSKLWLILVLFIFTTDVYAVVTGKETFTEALHKALLHPKRRWLVTLSWILTTKHLFFYKFLSWLDPFSLIGISALGIQKAGRYLNGTSSIIRHRMVELDRKRFLTIGSGSSNEGIGII